MKKIITLILIILPIFLIITISFAGRIFSEYNFVYVEKVYFANEEGANLHEYFEIELSKGDKYQSLINIYPLLATNKGVTYYSHNQEVATASIDGLITALDYGTTTITVKTIDGGKVASLMITVIDKFVTNLSFAKEEITISSNQKYNLSRLLKITPVTAINKNINWSSNYPEYITVSANGVVEINEMPDESFNEALVITAISSQNNEITATIKINIKAETLFEFVADNENINQMGVLYTTSKTNLNLTDYIKINGDVLLEDIKFQVNSGSKHIKSLTTSGELEFYDNETDNSIVLISIYVGESSQLAKYEIEIMLLYTKN